MKIRPVAIALTLQFTLLAATAPFCSAQNPLAALENAAKEKAAEEALTKVLNDNLPLTLDAKDVYPTVTTLPGGPFSPTPLQLTADQLNQPLPPGDYTINTFAFCSEYSVHQPGAGTAYVLGPYEGKAAGAIGALIWRGTEQYQINPNSLQAVSWAIQSGLTYDQMPKTYQSIVDQVIPDFKSQITGDFVTNLENTYNSLAKASNLPPLDAILAKLGEPGQLALDAERQRQILTAENTNDQIKEQTLFQGQESGIYTPVKAEDGPWSERVLGQVYMKLQIVGGNMTTTNVMQIRVMPPPATTARDRGNRPNLVLAKYDPRQAAAASSSGFVASITNLMEGLLGYAQGKGAQVLGQVAVFFENHPIQLVTPAEAAEPTPAQCPAKPQNPTLAQSSQYLAQINAVSESCAISACSAASNPNTTPPDVDFASCSGAISSQQLYSAYNGLYNGSQTFRCLMSQIHTKAHVLVVDGTNGTGKYFAQLAIKGYNIQLNKTGNEGKGLSVPVNNDWAYTFKETPAQGGEIRTVMTAQNLLTHVYTTGYDALNGTVPDDCGATGNPQTANEPVEQLMAYELGQNGNCESKVSCFAEQVDEDRTNTIMRELGQSQKPTIDFPVNKTMDPSNCQIQSGANAYSLQRALDYAKGVGGVVNFANQTMIRSTTATANPNSAEIYDSIRGDTHTTFDCNIGNTPASPAQ